MLKHLEHFFLLKLKNYLRKGTEKKYKLYKKVMTTFCAKKLINHIKISRIDQKFKKIHKNDFW